MEYIRSITIQALKSHAYTLIKKAQTSASFLFLYVTMPSARNIRVPMLMQTGWNENSVKLRAWEQKDTKRGERE